jgi:FtsP/CotA-like multicopper oxidase with cupredoxin domain
MTVDSALFPYLAFNFTPQFSPTNARIDLKKGDTLFLKVINLDTLSHGFSIMYKSLSPLPIATGDSASYVLSFQNEGVFIFFDSLQYPFNRYMGLAGMICVNSHQKSYNFYWNLKEHQKSYNHNISKGLAADFKTYYPDYFTINGKSYPDLQMDAAAKVTGSVGDTIRIFVANSGQSRHSIHFHGFHSKIIASNLNYMSPFTDKETFAFGSMEWAILEMVPDKVGLYSVHDHNLVAMSGGGVHPNGMFIIMEIK